MQLRFVKPLLEALQLHLASRLLTTCTHSHLAAREQRLVAPASEAHCTKSRTVLRVRASPPTASLENVPAATNRLLLTKHIETYPLSSVYAASVVMTLLRDAACRDRAVLLSRGPLTKKLELMCWRAAQMQNRR